MRILIDNRKCMGCSLCVLACPERAISCYGTAVLVSEKCTGCSICVSYCPVSAILARKETQ